MSESHQFTLPSVIELYNYAFSSDILSFDKFSLDEYFDRYLLPFLAKKANIAAIILRSRDNSKGDGFPVRGILGISRQDADQHTHINSSSAMVREMTSRKSAVYCPDLRIEPNIEPKQKTFLLNRGYLSAVYAPFFSRDTSLLGFTVFLTQQVDGFPPDLFTVMDTYLRHVISVIFSFASDLKSTRERLLRQVIDSRDLATTYRAALHDAKVHVSYPYQRLPTVAQKIGLLCPDSDDKNRLLDLVTVLHSNASEAFTEIDRALKKNLTHTQSLDMMQLIKDSIRPLQFKLENVHLVWPDTSSSVSIEGNEAQLKHLFFNIFYNAYLSIQKALATRAITQGRISICLECDSVGKIIIQISDNGIGLSEETRNQAMNGNFTGWPELGGTGNGIAICREFAALHGGSFDIHGTADGACATVILKRPKP